MSDDAADDTSSDESGDRGAADGRATTGGSDPLADRLEPLQVAAHQLIAAARGFLDAAESVVDDPDAVAHVLTTMSETAHEAVRIATVVGRRATRTDASSSSSSSGSGDDPDDGPVHTIPVS